MTDADLLAFLRYFVSTRNWATWNAISDAYADAGDELGAAIAVRIRDGQYWPLQTFHGNFVWERERDDGFGRSYAVPDEATTACFHYSPGDAQRKNPIRSVESSYVVLINAFRVGLTRYEDIPA